MPENIITYKLSIRKHLWKLYAKSMIKITTVLLITMQFLTIQPLISLIILFFAYFTMPTFYYRTEPFKAAEAWMRIVVGYLIAGIAWVILSGIFANIIEIISWPIYLLPQIFNVNNPAVPLTLIITAFFITLPRSEESPTEGEKVKIEFIEKGKGKIFAHLGGLTRGAGSEIVGNMIFIVLMLIAGITIITGWLGGGFQLVFTIIWVMSIIMGWFSGREGRPYIGVLMVGISVLALSLTFTGIVGQAVFGAWWPAVQNFAETTISPITDVVGQATSGLGDAWLLLTNPAEYYRRQTEAAQARASRVETGGSVKSIEVTTFDLFSDKLDPDIPLLGYIELENKGEFDAANLWIYVYGTWLPIEAQTGTEPEMVGKIGKITCGANGIKHGENTEKASCEWQGGIYPDEIKTISFKFSKNEWGEELQKCIDNEGNEKECETGDAYKHGGEFVKINAEYNFSYNVNVSTGNNIEILNESLYDTLLQNRQLERKSFESRYSGGPAKATIWTQKQPLKNGEESLIVASIYNQGKGEISDIKYSIYIPSVAFEQTFTEDDILSETFDEDCSVEEVETGTFENYYNITCEHRGVVKSSDDEPFKRVSFLIKPQIGNIDRKTITIVGTATYTYEDSKSKTIEIVWGRPS